MAGHLFMLFLDVGTRTDGTDFVKDLKVELLGLFVKKQFNSNINVNAL